MNDLNPEPFEILPANEMQEKYGLYAENRPIILLDPKNVPEELHALIPLAEKWGVSDDIMRGDLVGKAPIDELRELKQQVESHENLLEGWLAGPEAEGLDFTSEYIAFSCMWLASDTRRIKD